MNAGEQTHRYIREAFRREHRARTAREIRVAISALILLTLVCLGVDALFALPVMGLDVLRWLWLALVVGASCCVGYRKWTRRFDPRRVALEAQKRQDVPNDRLINALEFSESSDAGGSPDLREFALLLSEELTEELDPEALFPPSERRASWVGLTGLVLFTFLLVLLVPRFFIQPGLRLLQPRADHPPFSLLRFEVVVSPDLLHRGQVADVQVRIRGPRLPKEASLLLRNKEDLQRRLRMIAQTKSPQKEAGFRLKLRQIQEDLVFCIDTPRGRSAWQSLRLHPSPRFEEVRTEIHYPAYTGWKPKSQVLRSADLKALEGSTVQMELKSNLPLSHGELRFFPENGEEVRVRLEPGQAPEMVRGQMELTQSGAYQLYLYAQDGTPSDRTWEGNLEVVPDQTPRVSLLGASEDGLIPSDWKLEVAGQARDDVAVEEARLRYQLQKGNAKLVSLTLPGNRKEMDQLRVQESLDLQELGIPEGSTIRMMMEVRDNRPPEGQWGRSELMRLHVISPDVYADIARSQYQAEDLMRELQVVMQDLSALQDQREELLSKLDSLKEEMVQGGELTQEQQQQQMQEIQHALQSYQNEVGELENWIQKRLAFDQLYGFEEPYHDWLGKLSDGLKGQLEDAAALDVQWDSNGNENPFDEPTDLALQAFRENEDPFPRRTDDSVAHLEEDVERLQRLSEVMHQTQRLQALAEDQQELADQMEMLQRGPESAEEKKKGLRDLARQQEQLERELRDIQKALADSREQIGDEMPDLTNQISGLEQAIRDLNVLSDQKRAASDAARGRGADAEQFANLAAGKLKELSGQAQQCESACQGEGGSCQSLTAAQVQATMDQLLAAMSIRAGRLPQGLPMGLKVGGMGVGMGGNHSFLSMVGPQYPSRGGNSTLTELRGRAMGEGAGASVESLDASEASSGAIRPETLLQEMESTSEMPGVPGTMRDMGNTLCNNIGYTWAEF